MNKMTIKARVHSGKLVIDEPTDLPEDTEVELADVAAGRLVDAAKVLKALRSR